MTDRLLRQLVIGAATLAVLAVLFDAPSPIRVPLVLGFAVLAPGLAVSRFIPTLTGIDRIAVAGSISLALNVVASLLLVALDRWDGEPVLMLLAATTLLAAVAPLQLPSSLQKERRERLRNEQILERRRTQALAYEQVQSDDVEQRRDGLIALSWILEDDNRRDEATRLRGLARLEDPPQLHLVAGHTHADAELQLVHEHVRSEDPEVHRRGLLEVAELLDDGGA